MEHFKRRRGRGAALAAVGATLLFGLAACSSSSKPAAGGGTSTTGAAGSTGTTSSAGATGSPFVAESIASPLTAADYNAGIVAATMAINAAGGVNGHPIQIKTCSDNNDAATAATCARNTISDSSVLSLVDTSSSYGNAYDSLLQAAHMANLALLPGNAADQSSPIAFPLYGGNLNSVAGPLAAVQFLGAKTIGIPYIGVPAGAQLAPFIGQFAKALGAQTVGVESIPPTATDYSSYAAKELAAKPDIVADGLTSAMYESLIKAIIAQGGNLTYEIATGVFDAQQIQATFGTSAKVVLVNEYDHSAPGYQQFLSDMAKYNPSAPDTNDSALSGWIGVEAFAQVLKAVTGSGTAQPTRADIVNYLNQQTAFDVDGLTDGLNYTKPATGLGGAVPRAFTTKVWLAYAQNGQEAPINGGKAYTLPGFSS